MRRLRSTEGDDMKLTDQELTAQEMVDWANANMERVEELEAKIERLTSDVSKETKRADGNLDALYAAIVEESRLEADNERLTAKLSYAETWAHNQYGNLKEDNERLRAIEGEARHIWNLIHVEGRATQVNYVGLTKALAVEDKKPSTCCGDATHGCAAVEDKT